MTDDWVKSVNLDIFECAKWMMVAGKKLHQKATGEYETTNLRTPYRIIALMLNRIFGRENGKFYKMSWVPLIYQVAMQGTIFNWENIVENIFSSYIVVTQGGMNQRKL